MVFSPRLVLWLALAAFLLRAGFGLHASSSVNIESLPDQREYLELAKNLLSGHGLSMTESHFGQTVYAYRAPGYPLFLATFGASVIAARLVQAILSASLTLAVYVLARRWLNINRSLFAAAIVALNPFLISFSALILSETLFIATLTWGMVLLVRPKWWLLGALLLALGVLVRPSSVLLPTLLGLGTFRLMQQPGQRVREVGRLLLPTLLTVAALVPWAWRNQRVLAYPVWLTTNGGITRLDGFHAAARGNSDQSFMRHPSYHGLVARTEVERDRILNHEANRWIVQTLQDDPLRLLRLTLVKIARTWSPVPLSREFGRPLYVTAAAAYAVPFFLLVVGGLLSTCLPARAKLFLLLPAIYLTFVHAASVGSLRYRIPAEPVLAVVAASAGRGRKRAPATSDA